MKISYIKPDTKVLEIRLEAVMYGISGEDTDDSTDAPALNTEIEDDTNSI